MSHLSSRLVRSRSMGPDPGLGPGVDLLKTGEALSGAAMDKTQESVQI